MAKNISKPVLSNKRFSITLSLDLYKRLDLYSKKIHASKTSIIALALDEFLNSRKK